MSAATRPRFYLLIAIALVTVSLIGFARSFYLRPLSGLPPLTTLLSVHGVVFTAWLAVFLMQVSLVSAGRVDLHRKLGIASAVFGVIVIILGLFTTIGVAATPRVSAGAMTPGQVTIIGFTTVTLFAISFLLGVAYRRRAALHKRFMILAMIAALTPAVARLLRLVQLHEYRAVLIPGIIAAFIAWCLVHDWRQHRMVHPIYAIGGAIIVASWPLRQIVGHSDWYRPFGDAVVRLAHRMLG